MMMSFSRIFRGFRCTDVNVLVHNHSMLELNRRMPSKQSDNVGLWKPSKARYEFRTNPEWQGKTSSGFCMGYLQANLAILPSSLAKDFQRFCELNNAPCPLLYRSKTGELSAGFLAPDSDVRYNESSRLVLMNRFAIIGQVIHGRLPWITCPLQAREWVGYRGGKRVLLQSKSAKESISIYSQFKINQTFPFTQR